MDKKFYINTDNFSVKKVGSDTLKIAGYANTVDKDRVGDIIEPSAWVKGIDNFRKNPVLLLQHDHSKPVGKVTSVTVDRKGIFIEATVSDAAESLHGLKTLIKDGVLKSFSVGFQAKDGHYDKANDTFIIKELELLEVSVVSVPANQNSLFSVRKSFETEDEFKSFVKSLEPEEVVEEEITIDTTQADSKIPMYNLLNSKATNITEDCKVHLDSVEYTVDKSISADSQYLILKAGEKVVTLLEPQFDIINDWDLGTSKTIYVVSKNESSLDDVEKTQYISKFGTLVNMSAEDIFKHRDRLDTKQLDTIILLKQAGYKNWSDNDFKKAKHICDTIEALLKLEESENRTTKLLVYGHTILKTLEEKTTMGVQNTEEPLVISTKAANSVSNDAGQPATVAEPMVTQLIQKTGEAMLRAEKAEYTASETNSVPDARIMDELRELKAQLNAMREQAYAVTNSKMIYQEQSRKDAQFSERDKANAFIIGKALGKYSALETNLGARMKAVVTDSNLKEAFSLNMYEEMRQQLVIAPMFRKIEVNTKSFRVPVADEDTSDYIAQFPSGSFAAGVSDTTTVPTSRQAQISAIELTPHKFMAATHIAKDEEEETILPLIDFIREATANRLARGVDKALLRGDGTLSAFSTNNTLSAAGSYPSVIKGIVEHAAAVPGLVVKTSTTIDKLDPSDIASARLALGRYGLVAGSNLAIITSIEGYNNLVTTSDFQTVDKFGSQATYLTGSLGALYGIPIYISEFMDTAAAADSNLGLIVYKPGFILGERRATEIETEYLPQQQVTAMYMSVRFDFKPMTTVANAALSTRYSYASLITTAST